jgi:hypothetical protein
MNQIAVNPVNKRSTLSLMRRDSVGACRVSSLFRHYSFAPRHSPCANANSRTVRFTHATSCQLTGPILSHSSTPLLAANSSELLRSHVERNSELLRTAPCISHKNRSYSEHFRPIPCKPPFSLPGTRSTRSTNGQIFRFSAFPNSKIKNQK